MGHGFPLQPLSSVIQYHTVLTAFKDFFFTFQVLEVYMTIKLILISLQGSVS